MGQCCVTPPATELADSPTYPRILSITINPPNPAGRPQSSERIRVKLTSPKLTNNVEFDLQSFGIGISQCVLPGLDPREEVLKECQDGLFSVFSDNQVLVGLFDGHGKEGLKIVECCCKYLKGYFLAHLAEFREDPERAAERALHGCDEEVIRTVACATSGW